MNKYDHDHIIELVRSGLTYPMIHERLGISTRQIERIVAARVKIDPTIPHGETPIPFSKEELARMKELLDEGVSIEEVARTMNRSGDKVRQKFPEYTWTPQQQREFAAQASRYRKVWELDRVESVSIY